MAKRKKPGNCRNSKDGSCLGKYLVKYEDNAPLFVCDTCGDTDTTWKKFYTEYLELFKQKENWAIEKHRISCILGFFCYMYKNQYSVDYTFSPSNPNPYSSKECRDANKLLVSFANNADMVRKYIYWVFTKVIRQSTNITSLAYLNTPALIRRFKLLTEKSKSLTRSSKIPNELYIWCKENTPGIFKNYELSTVNDLGALISYVKFYSVDEDTDEYMVINKATQLNLIKDGKLNIRD